MLKVLNHFRDLDTADRRACLYSVLVHVMRCVNRSKSELCSVGTDLLTEILVNWERGTKPSIQMLVVSSHKFCVTKFGQQCGEIIAVIMRPS